MHPYNQESGQNGAFVACSTLYIFYVNPPPPKVTNIPTFTEIHCLFVFIILPLRNVSLKITLQVFFLTF